MITRKDILRECVDRCIDEVYKWAQPSVDMKELRELAAKGEWKDDPEDPLYKHHYLSQENFEYIKKLYLEAYGLFDYWKDSIDLLLENLKNGGLRDIYIPDVGKPGDDNWSPGYRSSEKVKPLPALIGQEHSDIVLKTIEDYKDFYRFGGKDVTSVNFLICLGSSPTSNKQAVIDYWKSKGEDVQIEDFSVEDKYFPED